MNLLCIDCTRYCFKPKSRSVMKALEWAGETPGKRSVFEMKRGYRMPNQTNTMSFEEFTKILEKSIRENRVDDVVNNHGI